MEQAIKGCGDNKPGTRRPKANEVEDRKLAFIASLRVNGGLVSAALKSAGLARRTAYGHFKSDREFADSWQEALEISRDDLFAEAHRRAVDGDVVYSVDRNGHRTQQRRKSDTLLILLMKNSEAQKKWRGRLIQTGNLALNSVRTAGTELGLTEEQISSIQKAILSEFDNVSLI